MKGARNHGAIDLRRRRVAWAIGHHIASSLADRNVLQYSQGDGRQRVGKGMTLEPRMDN